METKCNPREAGYKRITFFFFAFLAIVGIENQYHMPVQIKAYQNDAFIRQLRKTLHKEFLLSEYGKFGALDVQGRNSRIRLKQILESMKNKPPPSLEVMDGTAGRGRLVGWGHPFLGGKAEKTVWLLTPGIPGGSLEIKAKSMKDAAS